MRIAAALILAALLELPAPAQSSKPPIYKVEFDIHEPAAGRTGPGTHYSILTDGLGKAAFQASTRTPIEGGTPSYVDTGAKIELAAVESNGKIALDGTIELSAITGFVNLASLKEPIVGQRKLNFHESVEFGVSQTLADDPGPGKQEIAVTVTKVN